MNNDLKDILEVIHLSENLKKEIRHSYLSDGRKESVAEHTFRVALMVLLIKDKLSLKVDSEKILKMSIIHDLAEAKAHDVWAFDSMNSEEVKRNKERLEREAMEDIKNILGTPLGDEVYSLWEEYERKESYEAKVVNAMDKLEAQLQHNEANFSTWIDIEKDMCYMLDRHVEFEPILKEFKDIILDEAENKMKENNVDIESIKNRVLKK